MKPRSLIVLLTSLSMILCSCGKKPEPTPEPEPEPIVNPDPEPQPQPTPVVNHYTVTFYSEGQLLDTQSVEEGQKAVYSGQTPTKPADGDVYKYLFRGWDKDIDAAITEDTRFNAVFGAYYEEVLIDDFESYDDSYVYNTCNGICDKDGNIQLNGNIVTDKDDEEKVIPVVFTLVKVPCEDGCKKYKATNSFDDKVIELQI